jgi:hypothetical protein
LSSAPAGTPSLPCYPLQQVAPPGFDHTPPWCDTNIFTAEEEVVGLHTQALPSSNLNDQLHHAQI